MPMIPIIAQLRIKTQHLCYPPLLSFVYRGIIHIKCFSILLDFTNHYLPKQSSHISIFLAFLLLSLLNIIFLIEIVDLQCCVVSGVQKKDSVIHISIYIFFFRFFHYRLLQDIEYIVPCAIQ